MPPRALKKTLIKDRIGAVRASSYDLPTESHVYGKEVSRDEEGAGRVVFKWVTSVPSEAKESNRSFVETNKQAIVAGCRTAAEQRQFVANNKKRQQAAAASKASGAAAVDAQRKPHGRQLNEMTFGQKTQYSESIRDLIQAKHTAFVHDDNDYPDLSGMRKKGHLPPPKDTKSSRGKDVRLSGTTNQRRAEPERKPFVLKKFARVQGRLPNTQPYASSKRHAANRDAKAVAAEVKAEADAPAGASASPPVLSVGPEV